MSTNYVEQKDEGYWISGTRVSLDSIVYSFIDGQTAESIAQAFPVLRLEQVYGAIAFYLAHRRKIDEYLRSTRTDFEARRAASRDADPMFYEKVAIARRKTRAMER